MQRKTLQPQLDAKLMGYLLWMIGEFRRVHFLRTVRGRAFWRPTAAIDMNTTSRCKLCASPRSTCSFCVTDGGAC